MPNFCTSLINYTNGYKIRGNKICRQFTILLIWISFIGQFIHPVIGDVMGLWTLTGVIVILANCENNFIRVHKCKSGATSK